MIDLTVYKKHKPTLKPNLTHIPINRLGFNDDDVKKFNEVYQYCFNNKNLNHLEMTKSGGICIKKGILRGPAYHIRRTNTSVEIILRNEDGCYYRFLIGYKKDKSGMNGRAAFSIYKETLEKFGVNLEDFAIENGKEVKMTSPSPKIDLVKAIPGRTYYNANHLDINSAFNAGMMKTFPQLEPAIRHMYNLRKQNGDYKNVLNMTQGFMQSEMVGWKYAHISKSGYVFTNNYIEQLTKKLNEQGLRVLSYNTDGIWYDGGVYHDENEGTDIGQWKNDKLNVKVRFKSKGAYEYANLDGSNYTPVVRGESTYEAIVKKEDWVWGDILKGTIKMFELVIGEGIKLVENEFEELKHSL